MSIKNILFIDDEDVSPIAEKLEWKLKAEGISARCTILQIKTTTFSLRDENGKVRLDFKKIKKTLADQYMDMQYDIVACDYNFKDKSLNGFKLIKWLKNEANKGKKKKKIRRATFTLYSSEKEENIKILFGEEDISSLIRLKLGDFFDRPKLAEAIALLIIKLNNTMSLNDKLLSELGKYSDLKFRSLYPLFSGKTIGKIAEEIENETHHGMKFQEALIEQSVANMIELNDE